MCGIVGVRRFDGGDVDVKLLRAMTERLVHRGPDADGYWVSGPVGFGHRRLSIIDLAGSSQPMATVDGHCHLTFNGEILNYRDLRRRFDYPYRTEGDSETILACFSKLGDAAFGELEGQFALGVHDARSGALWLARDRAGILPLYYYVDGTLLAFASEIKALLPAMRSVGVDTRSLDAYLSQRAVPAPYTFFEGVRKLPPAHVLRVGERGIEEPRRYWHFPMPAESRPSPQNAVEQVATTLREAVASALVADVPVGAYLSGGVDSSLIVALMSELRQGGSIKTFSAGFGDPRYDELPFARQVSEWLRTEHHEVALRPDDDFRGLWRRLTFHRDAPISDAADIAVFRLAELARRSVTVVLSGEGSDELFGGYPKHRYARVTSNAGLLPASLRSAALGMVERHLPHGAARLRIALRALAEGDELARLRGWFSPFTTAERSALLMGAERHPEPKWRQDADGDPLRQMLLLDVQSWLADNLLERGDRMSMAASLELRPPFLDRRMLELAFSLPSSLKVHKGENKWLVKQVALRYLPENIVYRRKLGFKVPVDAWFRGGLETFAWDTLTSQQSFVCTVFDRAVVKQVLERHRSARLNEEIRIWTLLSLEIWYDQFFRSDAANDQRPTLSAVGAL